MHYSEIQKENFYLEGLEFGLSENEAFKFANWKQSVVDEGVSSLSIGGPALTNTILARIPVN